MRTAYHNRRSRLLLRFCTCHRRCAAWPEGLEGGGIRPIVVDEQPSVAATVCGVEGVAKLASWREEGGDCSGSDWNSPRGDVANKDNEFVAFLVRAPTTWESRITLVTHASLPSHYTGNTHSEPGMVYSKAS